MERPAVELDREPPLSPQEIDLVGAKRGVELGLRQPSLADEGEEALLELRAGEGGVGLEEAAQGRGSRPTWMTDK